MIMNSFKKISTSVAAVTAGILVGVSVLAGGQAYAANVNFDSTRDCDNNAVMHCGAMNAAELQDKYAKDSSIAAIYGYFGISNSDVASLGTTAVAGHVTKSGDVVVNGKVVAKDALTAGRQNITGSSKVTVGNVTFYSRAPQVSFNVDKIDAFVALNKDGQFDYAILAACGNPVKASNVVEKPAPKPTPAPTPTPTPAPVKPVTKPAPAPVPAPAPAPAPAPVKAAPAATLPETGPAEVAGLVVAVSLMGVAGHYIYLKRRLA